MNVPLESVLPCGEASGAAELFIDEKLLGTVFGLTLSLFSLSLCMTLFMLLIVLMLLLRSWYNPGGV